MLKTVFHQIQKRVTLLVPFMIDHLDVQKEKCLEIGKKGYYWNITLTIQDYYQK